VVPFLSRLTGVVPFAVSEVLVLAYLALRGTVIVQGIREVRDGRRRGRHLAAGGGLVLFRDLGVAVALFYALWGFHYARPPLAERIALPSVSQVATDELQLLADAAVDEGNRAYLEIHGTEDAGVPTAPARSWRELSRALEAGWSGAAAELDLPAHVTRSYGPPKPFALSPLLVRTGTLGFYFPWTAEAIVNRELPAVLRGRSAAHEQAHQRGITSEGEATFLGWVAAIHADDPRLRYSAAIDAQRRLLALLASRDREGARALRARRLPGVARDFQDLARFAEQMRGPASAVATRINDAYLRANRVEGGVANYGTASTLLLRYAASRGGDLFGSTN